MTREDLTVQTGKDSAGDLTAARRARTQALRIFDEIDHPDRDRIRTELRADDHAAAAGRRLAPQTMG